MSGVGFTHNSKIRYTDPQGKRSLNTAGRQGAEGRVADGPAGGVGQESGNTCRSDKHHVGPGLGLKRENGQLLLCGDLKLQLEVQVTGQGVSMIPYTVVHSLQVWVSHL